MSKTTAKTPVAGGKVTATVRGKPDPRVPARKADTDGTKPPAKPPRKPRGTAEADSPAKPAAKRAGTGEKPAARLEARADEKLGPKRRGGREAKPVAKGGAKPSGDNPEPGTAPRSAPRAGSTGTAADRGTPRRAGMDERIRERRRAVIAQRARRRRRATYSVLALLLVAGTGVTLLRTPLFDISEVRIDGVQGEQAEQARAAAGVRPGENLLAVDLSDAERRVEGLAWVAEARARRVAPSGVVFTVTRREPVAVLSVGEAAWLLDAGGFVVAGGSQPGLVPVVAPNAVPRAVGDRIADPAVRGALTVHAALPGTLRSQVDAYDAADEQRLRLHLRDPAGSADAPGVWVTIGPAERIAEKAAVTIALLERVRAPDGPAVAEMDVRAPGNPVLIPAGVAP